MCKGFVLKLVFLGLSVIAAIGFLTGCSFLKSQKDYYTFKNVPGALHRIEAIELKEIEEEDYFSLDEVKPASDKIEISLEECRTWTLKNNLDLAIQLIDPAIAEERVNEQEADFETKLSVVSSYSNNNSPIASFLEINGNREEEFSTDLDVDIPLKIGGTINISLNDSRRKTNSLFNIINPEYKPYFSASLTQPLLRGAGKFVNTYYLRIEEFEKKITDARTKQKAIDVIASVDRAYWDLYSARRLLDVCNQQYEMIKTTYEQMEHFVETGIQARIELIRIRASVASARMAVINAKNAVRERERMLKLIINRPGLGIKTETSLIPSTEPLPVHYIIQREQVVAKALENRMDLLELKLRIAQDETTIDKRRNEALPWVLMQYEYRINSLGRSRGDSFDLLYDNKFKNHSVFLTVSIPIGNKAAKSRIRQAKYQRGRRLIECDSKKIQIKKDVIKKIDQLDADWASISAARKEKVDKNERYKLEKHRLELGIDTSLDLLKAQAELTEASRKEINALTDYQKSLVDLAVATGTLPETVNFKEGS